MRDLDQILQVLTQLSSGQYHVASVPPGKHNRHVALSFLSKDSILTYSIRLTLTMDTRKVAVAFVFLCTAQVASWPCWLAEINNHKITIDRGTVTLDCSRPPR